MFYFHRTEDVYRYKERVNPVIDAQSQWRKYIVKKVYLPFEAIVLNIFMF
jgi:hypothetical protein